MRSDQLKLPLYGYRRQATHFFKCLARLGFRGLRPRAPSGGPQVKSLNRGKGSDEEGPVGASDMASVYYRLSAEQGRVFRKTFEFVLSICAVFLGVQFAVEGWPPAVVGDLFLPMSRVGGPVLWGIGFVVLAVGRLGVLVVNGWWKHTHLVRRWLSLAFLFLVWLPLAACYWTKILSGGASLASETNVSALFVLTVVAAEYLIFYAHTSFVYVGKAFVGERGTSGQ